MDRRIWLGFMVVAALALRLYFALQADGFTGDEAYYTLRQVEHIREYGLPVYDDPLSSAERGIVINLFHYLLAFFSLLMPVALACKIMPNVFAVSASVLLYMLVDYGTRNWKASLTAASVSLYLPLFFSETINSISVHSLAVPVTLALLLLLLQMNIRKNPNYFILLLCTLLLLDSSVFIFILAMLIYLLLLAAESLQVGRAEKEIILFSVFLTSWFYLVFYKELFALHGPEIIWQNLPDSLFTRYFADVNALQAVYLLGIIPVIGALYVMFNHLFKLSKKTVYLYAAMAFSSGLIVWLKLIQLEIGLIYLSLAVVLLFGEFISDVFDYLEKSRFAAVSGWIVLIVVLLFVISSGPAAIMYSMDEIDDVPTDLEVVGMRNLAIFSAPSDVVAASPEEGHLLQYFSERKTVIDTEYMGYPDVEQRLRDLKLIYTSAIYPYEIYDKYGIRWVYFSKDTGSFYNATRISYLDPLCFISRYDNGEVQIIEHLCGGRR